MRVALLLVVAACVRDAVPAKFYDRPVVTASDDARPIPEPKERTYYGPYDLANATIFDPIIDGLDGPEQVPAGDTNALDELPDSTWFTNRLGVRTVTPEELAKGPDVDGPPQLPFEVTHAKTGGGNPGFIGKDARGKKYLFKFDTAENPGQQTATDNIVCRIFWAIGYHVPADYIVHFKREELVIAKELRANKKVDDQAIDKMLEVATKENNVFRATASQLLDGKPKGGWSQTGTRPDDPNDRVPHERRRVLRGMRVFAAWLNHTDMKDDNGLDMYVGDHLVHYLVDFGEAFGGHQSEHQQPEIGFEYSFDWAAQPRALVSFGLWHRRWEHQRETKWKQVGYFSAIDYDPAHWKVLYPYVPFKLADRADLYWGAKLVMRFDRPMLEAAVATGELGDPEAAKYLVDVLMARRAAIGAAFLDRVTPLDDLQFTGGRLCGTDLARKYQAAADGELIVDGVRIAIAPDGQVCATVPMTAGYHIAHVQIGRSAHTTPVLEVHYVGGDAPHVVGLVR